MIVCPPSPSLHDAVGMLAVTEIGVFAQNAHWAKEGPYTGEVSPWMLRRWASAARIVGALGAAATVRRDRRVGRAAHRGSARRGAARDRLCRRDRGRARGGGDRARDPPSGGSDQDGARGREPRAARDRVRTGLGDRHRATATPEQAEEAHELDQAPARRARALRRLGQAREREELLSQPDVDGALVGGASLEVESFAAICRAAVPLVALVILDGLGLRAARTGERDRARPHAGLRPPLAEFPHTTLEASGEAVGLPPGQMGNSEVGHLTIGCGPRARPGPPAREPRDRATVASSRTRHSSVRFGAHASATATSTCSASSRTAASTRTSSTCARCSSSQARGDAERTWIHAFTDGRDVSPTSALHDLAELPGTGSRRSPAATTRWTATSARNGRSSHSTRSSPAGRRRGRAARLRPRRATSRA